MLNDEIKEYSKAVEEHLEVSSRAMSTQFELRRSRVRLLHAKQALSAKEMELLQEHEHIKI